MSCRPLFAPIDAQVLGIQAANELAFENNLSET
jgi:hypothetical protein